MSLAGRWTVRAVTPDLVGKFVIVGAKPEDDGVIGMVIEVDGLIVTIQDELGDLHTVDTSDGKRIWTRA